MIVKRKWTTRKKSDGSWSMWEGWFLFWFIPLYIRQV